MPDLPWLTTKNQGRAAAWLTIAVTLVAGFEGYASKPYIDTIGRGHPETWCYGKTAADAPPPPMTMTFTKAQCQDELGQDLQKYDDMVHSCIKVPLPPHREAALVSFTYNLGQRALCSGEVARGINAGNVAAGCGAMRSYDHSLGKVVKGLTRRRQSEYELCLRND